MRVIILGTESCPHCRAVLRLLESIKDESISYGYMEMSIFFQTLTDEDKTRLLKRIQSKPIHLPLVLVKKQNNTWDYLDCSKYTKNLLLKYTKDIVNVKRSSH